MYISVCNFIAMCIHRHRYMLLLAMVFGLELVITDGVCVCSKAEQGVVVCVCLCCDGG